ncbi:MAG: alpha/beta hydrolase [Actinomycetota bacterium]|nr:alpha/beta hydrolase [Actinomycetota bacterium]
MDQHRVTANGIDFAYLEEGPADGPLALCLHGFPDHAPTYERLLGDLGEAGFRAVAPWMRGYHPTGLAPDANYQVASLALDAIALADTLAPERPAVLVGHDWGAMAAYTAVTHAPTRFSRLANMAVPHAAALGQHIFDPAQLKRSWYQFFFQLPFADGAVPMNDFAVIDELWRDWSPGYEPDPGFMAELKKTLGAPGSLTAALDYYRFVYGTKQADPALAEVQAAYVQPTPVPTLYLHGTDDGVMGADTVVEDELRPNFPAGLELVMVPGTGHFLHLEEPDVVNHRIVTFLQD